MSANNLSDLLHELHLKCLDYERRNQVHNQSEENDDDDDDYDEDALSGLYHHPEICGAGLVGGAFSGGCANCGYNPAHGAGKKRKVAVKVPVKVAVKVPRRKQGAGYDKHCVSYRLDKNGKRSCLQYAPNDFPGLHQFPNYPEDYDGRRHTRPGSAKQKAAARRNPWLAFVKAYAKAVDETEGAQFSLQEAAALYKQQK